MGYGGRMSTNVEGYKSLVAIIAIALVAFIAMNKEIDGQLVLACILAIAGLGGYDVYTALKRSEATA
jgi:UDP-N-acetylmuramyl pentapeptide phosphotransferase/UDP-N-acetylglucosamine-1-phosphate transferase